jgi:acyl carrier protein
MTICPKDFDAQMLHHVKEIELALFVRNKYYGDDISIKELFPKPIESESPIPPTIQLEFETNAILDYDSIEIARQLTIIQEELLCTIPREELFTCAKDDKQGPRLEKMTEYYNRVKWWIGYEITAAESVQDRVQILEKFVDIGLECLQLLNINMVLAISAGLTLTAVQQLKQTVSEGYTMKREKLLQYLDYNTGTQQLLMLNRYTRTPSIPYINLFMINLSHIEKSDPTYLNNNGIEMINFYKLRRYSEVIAQIQSRQVGEKYKLQVYPRLKELLQNIPLYSEQQVIKQGSARNRIKGLFE